MSPNPFSPRITRSPTGTVTFLFTDIEGSSALWERDRTGMAAALERHDALLRGAVEAHGGHVFKMVGDAGHAVFATAPSAAAAALAAQRAFFAEPWPDACPLRVRMALHTGAAELRDGDYFGPPLNRVARILSAGHGGQILLSLATAELARDVLPEGVTLHDLGKLRLKDLQRPERVFQLAAPDLLSDFPPLRSLDVHPHNLPVQPTPLVGREEEVAALVAMLSGDGVRLVTLTGPGGIGKTRLGLQVAAELVDRFEDGVFFVGLGPIRDPALVTSAVSQALTVREAAGRSLLEALQRFLRDRRLVLLLDNFEQLLQAATVVADLLSACPGLKVLVTSRAALHVRGEKEFPVPPLAIPDQPRRASLEWLTQYEAVRLFLERAQDVKPRFAITNRNAPAVAEICVRLDGLPLAIELAAARVKLLPPEAMLPRLRHSLQLLTGGSRDLPARQRTLRDTIAWSHDLLAPEEQRLFRRLSVFVGGFTLEAAEAVCAGKLDDAEDRTPALGIDVVDGLASLVDGSLVRQEEDQAGEPRFTMLETIREYAAERLVESGEADAVHRRQARYYLRLVERVEPELFGGLLEGSMGRLEREHDNLRAALEWSLARSEEAETGVRLAAALWRFWWVHGHLREGREWLERTRSASRDASAPVRAKLLVGASNLAWLGGDLTRASRDAEESLAFYRRVRDERGIALALSTLGIVSLLRGEAGDQASAQGLFEECLALSRSLDDKWLIARCLNSLGEVARERGENERAAALYREALATNRAMTSRPSEQAVTILFNLGILASSRRRFDEARPLFEEGLAMARELGDKRGIACGLVGLAGVWAVREDFRRAASLLGASEALREEIQWEIEPMDRPQYDRFVEDARVGLSETEFATAWAEGRRLPPEQAISLALGTSRAGSAAD